MDKEIHIVKVRFKVKEGYFDLIEENIKGIVKLKIVDIKTSVETGRIISILNAYYDYSYLYKCGWGESFVYSLSMQKTIKDAIQFIKNNLSLDVRYDLFL